MGSLMLSLPLGKRPAQCKAGSGPQKAQKRTQKAQDFLCFLCPPLAFVVRPLSHSHILSSDKARSPGPLKIKTAEMARNVDDFSDEIESRHMPGFHCFRG